MSIRQYLLDNVSQERMEYIAFQGVAEGAGGGMVLPLGGVLELLFGF